MSSEQPKLSEAEEKRREKHRTLMRIFPSDTRLINALLMGEGVCEQLPALAAALHIEIKEFYKLDPTKPTQDREDKLFQSVADVLAWATQLELALHDLRGALFFRFNVRVQAMARAEAPAPSVTPTIAPLTPPPPIETPAIQEKVARVEEKLQGLFDDLK